MIIKYIPEWIYVIDILFFFAVLLAVLRGIRRGFYRELAGVLALILMMYGFYFGYPAVRFIVGNTMDGLLPFAQSAVSMLILLSLTIVFYLLVRVFSEQVLQARLGVFTDKFSGLVMGLIRGIVIWVALLAVLSELPNPILYEVFTTKSVAGQFLSERLSFLSMPDEDSR